MAEAIKIRATLRGDTTEIRILMQHPMETGLRKDPVSAQTIGAHFIQTFTVSANGKTLIEGQLNTSIARNPLFAFYANGLRAGEKVVVRWTDNRGEQRSDEAPVIAG